MTNNLIPPFIIREAGIIVNNEPKIHVNDPTNSDHAIIFKDTDFKIPCHYGGLSLILALPSHLVM